MREPAHLTRRAAAALPLAALVRPVPAAMPSPSADAELLHLGRRWQAALKAELAQSRLWRETMTGAEMAEHEAIGDDLNEVVRELFLAIVAVRATTPAGLAVKARILAYENDVEGFGDEAAIAAAMQARPYFEDKAALSLVLDLLSLAGCAS